VTELLDAGSQVNIVNPQRSLAIAGNHREATSTMKGFLIAFIASLALNAAAGAQDLITEKKKFELGSYTTVGGEKISNVVIGWEAHGTLNADKSNAILITHFFSGTSHAAGKYKPTDLAPGYWDAIIGPGKAVDTNKFFVISSDTLVNLNAKDPNVTTTGPASIDPATGKPYGRSFPIVTIRDFVNVQKALIESLGIRRLHAVMGASMGAAQAYEWASSYPHMVGKVVPVVAAGEADGYLIAWLDMWAAPIKLDPNWNNGDYYGRTDQPLDGLAASLKMITLHAQHWTWANGPALGRKWAVADKNPASCLLECKFAIEAELDRAGKLRAATADANHLLYLVKANQLFLTGGTTLADGLRRIEAPVLLITSDDDLIFHVDGVKQTAELITADSAPIQHVKIRGGRGHLDGVLAINQASVQIKTFLDAK
jgi:homoserine O-acetyltransferase/O-succinyltransferase